jgi:hypothetical protein
MRPRDHVILGGVTAGALYPVLGLNVLLLWIASFAVDIDHYLDFVYHNGFTDFSFKRMFEYHAALSAFGDRPEFLNVSIFHTVEFMAPLYAIAAYTGSRAVAAVFWGILIHITLDAIHLLRRRVLFKRSHSIIEYLIRRRLLINRGLSPIGVYSQAIRTVRTNTLNPR